MAKELTATQQKILEFIINYRADHGMPPTLAEIAGNFGYKNRATVQQHLQALEKKGYIKRNSRVARGIELTVEDKYFVSRPVLGEVAAGNPLTIYPDAIDSIELPTIAHTPRDSFLLRVKGDSLKDAYVFSGDIVIVNPNILPVNGHFVVAILDDAAVVKRFFKKESVIELHSENPEYQPIVLKHGYENFKIVGVVIGVYRSMDKIAG
ncbi:MAG: LexA repressor [Melioribacteraceae bacterium]|nr:MAG: LexA repressor [Melioribacteraceae bacterium]